MNCFSRISLVTLLALSSPVTAEVRAADWAQFRGPNRDSVWNETHELSHVRLIEPDYHLVKETWFLPHSRLPIGMSLPGTSTN